MALHFAGGIDMRLMVPQIALALNVASECYAEGNADCFVTCITRGTDFKVDGFHAKGAACDLSVKGIPDDVMDKIVAAIQYRLGRQGGGQFDVLDERKPRADSPGWTGPHLHLEHDPK